MTINKNDNVSSDEFKRYEYFKLRANNTYDETVKIIEDSKKIAEFIEKNYKKIRVLQDTNIKPSEFQIFMREKCYNKKFKFQNNGTIQKLLWNWL